MRETLAKVANALTARHGINVVFQGGTAYTDGKTIVLPVLPEEVSPELILKTKGYSDHETGHIKFSVFEPVIAKIRAMPNGEMVKNVTNAIEDIRVEHEMSKLYAGCRDNLQATIGMLATEIADAAKRSGSKVNKFLQLTLEGRQQVMGIDLGVDYKAECEITFGTDIWSRIAACTSTWDVLALALDILGLDEHGNPKKKQPEPKSKGKSDTKKKSKDKSKEESTDETGGKGGSEKETEDRKKDDGENSKTDDGEEGPDGEGNEPECEGDESGDSGTGSDGDDEADGSDGEAGGDEESDEGAESKDSGEGGDGKGDASLSAERGGNEHGGGDNADNGCDGERSEVPTELYADAESLEDLGEMMRDNLSDAHDTALSDGEYMVASTMYDRVTEVEPARDAKVFNGMKKSLCGLNAAATRMGQMFLTRTQSRWVNDREDGKINGRALHKVPTGATTIYKEKLMSRDRDTAITFLVDFSGSMSGKRIEAAMKSVVAFLEGLNLTGVKTEVLGYTTRGPIPGELRRGGGYGRIEGLQTYVFKSFKDQYSNLVKRRISNYSMCRLSENCDPDSVKVAYERLSVQKAQRKVLFVLTDGIVCNMGDTLKGAQYLKRLVPQIMRRGVEVVGIGLCGANVRDYYPRNISVNGEPTNLAKELLNGLKEVLAVA